MAHNKLLPGLELSDLQEYRFHRLDLLFYLPDLIVKHTPFVFKLCLHRLGLFKLDLFLAHNLFHLGQFLVCIACFVPQPVAKADYYVAHRFVCRVKPVDSDQSVKQFLEFLWLRFNKTHKFALLNNCGHAQLFIVQPEHLCYLAAHRLAKLLALASHDRPVQGLVAVRNKAKL